MTVTSFMSANELLQLPDDGYRYELVRGEPRKMSPSGSRHTTAGARIIISLGVHLKSTRLGVVFGADGGFLITRNPDTVLCPDVGFVRSERFVNTDHFFDGPPDVAIEVISPSDRYTEVDEKTQEWLSAGTRAVVVVNPRTKTVRVHRSGRTETLADAIAVDDVIPGWRMPFSEVFD